MRRIALFSAILVLASFSALAAPKTVTLLDRSEPWEAMTAHAGLLWVGKSRTNFNSDYRVEIYNERHESVGIVPLTHAANYIYPYSQKSVIVVGTGHTPNLTNYTIIEHKGAHQFQKRHQQIPMDAWANRWVGTINGREYFTDPGGNQNDPDLGSNPNLPAQTLFYMASSRPSYLPVRVRMPIDGVTNNGKLFVVQKEGLGNWKTNLMVIDPSTNRLTPVFENYRNDLRNVVMNPLGNIAAVSETGAHKLLLINSANLGLESEIEVTKSPGSVSAFLNCVVIGGMENRQIQFVNISDVKNPKIVATLDVEMTTDEFMRMSKVAVDQVNQLIYARSSMACNPIVSACDKDWNRVVAWGGEEAEAVFKQCRLY